MKTEQRTWFLTFEIVIRCKLLGFTPWQMIIFMTTTLSANVRAMGDVSGSIFESLQTVKK